MTIRKTGTREWSGSSCNISFGCINDCKYCYAKAASARNGRKPPNDWKNEELNTKAIEKQYQLRKESKQPVMFPTAHDITESNWIEYIKVLLKLLKSGNKVLIVSKPRLSAINLICKAAKEYKEQILFRFTIGSASDNVLSFWEPGAPDFDERVRSLKHAFDQGFQTSVSCEPMLDQNIERVVEKVRPYITETVWIGKMNNVMSRLKRNEVNTETMLKGVELVNWQNDEAIVKIYNTYQNDSMIKWKDSVREVIERTNNI